MDEQKTEHTEHTEHKTKKVSASKIVAIVAVIIAIALAFMLYGERSTGKTPIETQIPQQPQQQEQQQNQTTIQNETPSLPQKNPFDKIQLYQDSILLVNTTAGGRYIQMSFANLNSADTSVHVNLKDITNNIELFDKDVVAPASQSYTQTVIEALDLNTTISSTFQMTLSSDGQNKTLTKTI